MSCQHAQSTKKTIAHHRDALRFMSRWVVSKCFDHSASDSRCKEQKKTNAGKFQAPQNMKKMHRTHLHGMVNRLSVPSRIGPRTNSSRTPMAASAVGTHRKAPYLARMAVLRVDSRGKRPKFMTKVWVGGCGDEYSVWSRVNPRC